MNYGIVWVLSTILFNFASVIMIFFSIKLPDLDSTMFNTEAFLSTLCKLT